MSILLHHFKVLAECINEVERIEAKFNNTSKNKKAEEWELTKKVEEKIPATLDGFFVKKE